MRIVYHTPHSFTTQKTRENSTIFPKAPANLHPPAELLDKGFHHGAECQGQQEGQEGGQQPFVEGDDMSGFHVVEGLDGILILIESTAANAYPCWMVW